MDKNLLTKFIRAALSKTAGLDIITVTEVVADHVILAMEILGNESGVAAMPPASPSITRAPQPAAPEPLPVEWPIEAPHNPAATQRSDTSTLILPGDPEFQENVRSIDLPRVRGRGTKPRRDVQYWEAGDLIAAVNENMPLEIEFVPNGEPETTVLTAKRNVAAEITTAGVAPGVRVEYSVEGVSEGGIQAAPVGVPGHCTIGLTARHFFSAYEESHDFKAAIYGERGIAAQLKGLYRRRPKEMPGNPGPEPEPIEKFDYNQAAMKDREAGTMESNWTNRGDPTAAAKQSLVRANKALRV